MVFKRLLPGGGGGEMGVIEIDLNTVMYVIFYAFPAILIIADCCLLGILLLLRKRRNK
jgi:hypothetical protein